MNINNWLKLLMYNFFHFQKKKKSVVGAIAQLTECLPCKLEFRSPSFTFFLKLDMRTCFYNWPLKPIALWTLSLENDWVPGPERDLASKTKVENDKRGPPTPSYGLHTHMHASPQAHVHKRAWAFYCMCLSVPGINCKYKSKWISFSF